MDSNCVHVTIPGQISQHARYFFEKQHKTRRRICPNRARALRQLRASLVTTESSRSQPKFSFQSRNAQKILLHAFLFSERLFIRENFRVVSRHVLRSQVQCSSFATAQNRRKSATAAKQKICTIQVPSARAVSDCLHRPHFPHMFRSTLSTIILVTGQPTGDAAPRTTSTKVLAPPGGRSQIQF